MREPLVIFGSSRTRGLQEIYERQLRLAGIDFYCHPLPMELPNNNQGDLGGKIAYLELLSDRFSHYEKLIFTDAWDYLFFGTREEIAAQVPASGVLFAAERNYWPDDGMSGQFQETGTPWKYVCGGGMCGSPGAIHDFCEWVRQQGFDPSVIDQRWFNLKRIDYPEIISLDSDGRLFYTMFRERGELMSKDDRPWNSLTKCFPNFIHFNGKSPVPTWLQSLTSCLAC